MTEKTNSFRLYGLEQGNLSLIFKLHFSNFLQSSNKWGDHMRARPIRVIPKSISTCHDV